MREACPVRFRETIDDTRDQTCEPASRASFLPPGGGEGRGRTCPRIWEVGRICTQDAVLTRARSCLRRCQLLPELRAVGGCWQGRLTSARQEGRHTLGLGFYSFPPVVLQSCQFPPSSCPRLLLYPHAHPVTPFPYLSSYSPTPPFLLPAYAQQGCQFSAMKLGLNADVLLSSEPSQPAHIF